jgi:hypothetical protein
MFRVRTRNYIQYHSFATSGCKKTVKMFLNSFSVYGHDTLKKFVSFVRLFF